MCILYQYVGVPSSCLSMMYQVTQCLFIYQLHDFCQVSCLSIFFVLLIFIVSLPFLVWQRNKCHIYFEMLCIFNLATKGVCIFIILLSFSGLLLSSDKYKLSFRDLFGFDTEVSWWPLRITVMSWTIGESLFTLFASLTYAYHFLMMLIIVSRLTMR